MDVIHIRRAGAVDAAAVADVFLRSFHATYAFPLAHTDDEVRGWVATHLVPVMETWVAVGPGGGPPVTSEQILGFCAIAPGWLEQLYVDPARLGEGIGRLLLDKAKERQPDGLELWTFQVNARARRFYDRNGFIEAERTNGAGNQEHQPDVRFEWRPRAPAKPGAS